MARSIRINKGVEAMRQSGFLLIACFALAFTGAVFAEDEEQTTIVHAGTLLAIPGEAPRTQQSVLIRDGKILEIRDGFVEAEDDATTIVNLSDKFVLPGLMDMHVHLTGGRPRSDYATTSASDRAIIGVENAKKTLLAGFTTVRDLGASSAEAIIAVRDGIERGAILGPKILAAGQSISATAGHGDSRGQRAEIAEAMLSVAVCDGPADCRRAVRSQYKLGADTIKVHASGGGADPNGKQHSAPEMFDDELRAVVEAAHALDLKVGAHAHGTASIRAAIRANVDSVDHSTWLDDETIDMYLENGTYMVRTGYLQEYFLTLDTMPANTREQRIENKAKIEIELRKAIQRGVNMAMGTDAGVMPHGDNAKEFGYYVRMGMTPMQAIETGTINAAALLSMEDEIGHLDVGMAADIIATDESPLDDIAKLENVTFVMKDGVIYLSEPSSR